MQNASLYETNAALSLMNVAFALTNDALFKHKAASRTTNDAFHKHKAALLDQNDALLSLRLSASALITYAKGVVKRMTRNAEGTKGKRSTLRRQLGV